MYGRNHMEVSYRFLWGILTNEFLHPFYLFQVSTIVFWFNVDYATYASMVLAMTLLSTGATLYELYKVIQALRKDNKKFAPVFALIPDKATSQLIENCNVIPGLMCKISKPERIGFDAILISGKCIVTETSVTGDPHPKLKSPLPSQSDEQTVYDIMLHREHTIYAGSKIEQLAGPCYLLVISTKFNTLQGGLVKNMLFPRKEKYVHYEDAIWFAAFLTILSGLGFFVCLPTFLHHKLDLTILTENLFDLITVAVPPIFPAAIAIGTAMAKSRLEEYHIGCVSAPKITVAGKSTIVCFDAKGSVVEEGMTFIGYRTLRRMEDSFPRFGMHQNLLEKIACYFTFDIPEEKNIDKLMKARFAHAMATCHSLILYKNEIIGTSEDNQMLSSTGATLLVDDGSSLTSKNGMTIKMNEGKIVGHQVRKYYDDKKNLLSVVVQYPNEIWAYARIETNSLGKYCVNEEIPLNLQELVVSYEKKCQKVYAFCGKKLDSPDMIFLDWPDILVSMDFLGITVLQISLKDGIKPLITELKDANLKCKMFYEENSTLAISVARSAGIINEGETTVFCQPNTILNDPSMGSQCVKSEPLLYTNIQTHTTLDFHVGKQDYSAFSQLKVIKEDEEEQPPTALICEQEKTKMILVQIEKPHAVSLLKEIRVFSGLKKGNGMVDVISELSRHRESILMVGSSSSEYGSLSKSDAGILLSDSDNVCAFSAFTCSSKDLSAIKLIIAEGRGALVTSYECFKWMAISSIIQLTTTTLLYYNNLWMNKEQYLFLDGFLILTLAYTMSWSKSSQHVTSDMPQSSLLSIPVLASVAGQMAIQMVAQIVIFLIIIDEPNSCNQRQVVGEDCIEITVNYTYCISLGMFMFANVQYLVTSHSYTRGDKFREPVYKNVWFMINVLVGYVYSYFVILASEDNIISRFFGLVAIDHEIKNIILIGSFINIAASFGLEMLIAMITRCCQRKRVRP